MLEVDKKVQRKWNEPGNNQIRGSNWHTKSAYGGNSKRGRGGVKIGEIKSERQGERG